MRSAILNRPRPRLNEAQANYAKASADLKRMEMLIAKDEISHQQYDAAVAANNSAKANVEAATAGDCQRGKPSAPRPKPRLKPRAPFLNNSKLRGARRRR